MCSGCILCQKRLRLSWKVNECKSLPAQLGLRSNLSSEYVELHIRQSDSAVTGKEAHLGHHHT